jgi:hypothetical protein
MMGLACLRRRRQDHQETRQRICHDKHMKTWGVLALGAVVVALLTAGGMWAYGLGWFSVEVLASLTPVGVIVSGLGLFAAYMIYTRQRHESLSADRRQHAVLAEVQQVLDRIDRTVNPEVERAAEAVSFANLNEDTGEADPWISGGVPAETGILLETPDGTQRRVFTRSETPLRVIADLVHWWENNLDENGAWTIGDLVGGFRAPGRGNHPWFLVFSKDGKPSVIWKISKGKGSTVASKVENSMSLS